MAFVSILYDEQNVVDLPLSVDEPSCFPNLNLDQIVSGVTAGRDEYNLKPFFHSPPANLATVHYRHAVMKDLEQEAVARSVNDFSRKMRDMREQVGKLNKLYYKLQKQAVFLDAVDFYCAAVGALVSDLNDLQVSSSGLRAFRDYIGDYVRSDRFVKLKSEMIDIKRVLSEVEYNLVIRYESVTVSKRGNEPDYSAAVDKTFERFKQGDVKDYNFKFHDFFEMNHIEAGILDYVARIHSEIFARLDRYFTSNQGYLDPVIARWDREVQFYISYLSYIQPLRDSRLCFCYPRLSETSKSVQNSRTFDLALARKLVADHVPVITNDFELKGAERIFVVSGPNQGGKTTFARTFGQLHYLAKLGCPVPGAAAKLFFFDRLLTHFEKEEDIHSHRGKLEDDLVRVRDLLQLATPSSIVILNEIFTSTTLRDALFLARKILDRLIGLDLLCVCVTFMDELSTLGPQTVSLVSTVVPSNPAERTYRIVRRPADGRSYAMSIAEKYRITFDDLKERLAS